MLLVISGVLVWAETPYEAETTAIERMNQSIIENNENWIVFDPEGYVPSTGLVLYPGARVDYRAYAPHAEAIAEAGFKVIILPMPLNFAFLGINKAEEVIAAFPEIRTWAVGGHSLGGAMAAEFIKTHPASVKGLVLWAAYPGENNDLSTTNLQVLSVYASNDEIANLEEIESSKLRLPDETVYLRIDGGNHAGFGWYGSQKGDGALEISKVNQQNQIVAATVTFLKTLGED